MYSAGRNLIRDLLLIVLAIIFSYLLNLSKDSGRDNLEVDRFHNRRLAEGNDPGEFDEQGFYGNYLGVVDFGKIEASRNAVSQGSASYLGEGSFITARHVIDGCDFDDRVKVFHYHNSDLSIFRQEAGFVDAPVMKIKSDNIFDEGFVVGFPAGREASAETKYLGYAHQKIKGDFQVNNIVLVWAFYNLNIRLNELKGMSGGAVLDKNGNLIGVLSGEIIRRGRIVTTTLADTKSALRASSTRYTLSDDTRGEISQKQAFNLIKQNKVVKITCRS